MRILSRSTPFAVWGDPVGDLLRRDGLSPDFSFVGLGNFVEMVSDQAAGTQRMTRPYDLWSAYLRLPSGHYVVTAAFSKEPR